MTKQNPDAEDQARFSAFSFNTPNTMIEVTAQNYPRLAGKTERIPTGPTVLTPSVALSAEMILRSAIQVAAQVDRLKRAMIYGKKDDLMDVANFLPNISLEQKVGEFSLTPEQFRLMHAALGMLTEAAEFAETIADHVFKGVTLDPVNLKEEVGDQMWYQAQPMNIFGWKVESVMQTNIDKLAARYPEGFTEEKALNRDLAAERQILEGKPPATQ